jgi:putative DNA primase/helicase
MIPTKSDGKRGFALLDRRAAGGVRGSPGAAVMDCNNITSAKPTAKMIAYARYLAAQSGVILPASYDQDVAICRGFIDGNSPRRLDAYARGQLRLCAPEIIRSFFGEPNRRLCTKRQLRWGRKGSFALNLAGEAAGLWFDHESGFGGDIIDFLAVEDNCSIGEAINRALKYLGPGSDTPLPPHREWIVQSEPDDSTRIDQAGRIWCEVLPVPGSLAESYLEKRGIRVPESAFHVLGFHPSCPFGRRRASALLGLIQDIITSEPLGIHRRELTVYAGAAGPPMTLGPKTGAAVKLSNAGGTGELTIGEGIETCLAGMMLGLGPVWSVIDAGGLASFPVLEHISRLTILVDNDVSGTGQRAAAECRGRWMAAGKAVRRVMPETAGQDVNDLLLAQAKPAEMRSSAGSDSGETSHE